MFKILQDNNFDINELINLALKNLNVNNDCFKSKSIKNELDIISNYSGLSLDETSKTKNSNINQIFNLNFNLIEKYETSVNEE